MIMKARPCSCGSENLVLVVRETVVGCGLTALGCFYIKCGACGLRANEAGFTTLRGSAKDVEIAVEKWNGRK
jgi:hypothetical protein